MIEEEHTNGEFIDGEIIFDKESVDEESVDEEESDEEFIEEPEWEDLKGHPDYEICVDYPHQIMKKSNGMVLKESTNKAGYLGVWLDGKSFYKHRLIALQFIPNPNNLPCIDHINGIRSDNRIANLRWVSHLQNINNLHKSRSGRQIEFVQTLPDNAVVIEKYSRFEFKGVYFHGGLFYVDTGNNDYRIVPTHMNHGCRRVNIRDIYGIQRAIYYDKLLNEYGLD